MKFGCLTLQWRIQGRGPGGPASPRLIFRPPPLDDHPPPLSQGLYPALSCTYIILMVAILLIIGQLINRFSFSVFSLLPYLTVTVQGKHFILSLKVRGLRNRVKRNSIFSFQKIEMIGNCQKARFSLLLAKHYLYKNK